MIAEGGREKNHRPITCGSPCYSSNREEGNLVYYRAKILMEGKRKKRSEEGGRKNSTNSI